MRYLRRFLLAAARCSGAVGVVLFALSATPRAFAQSAPATRSTDIATAGARAHSLGKYDFAIQALTQAHQLSKDHELLFAIAEAHRQRWALRHRPQDLAQAVAHYRRYLERAPAGERRSRAQAALGELEPKLEGATLDEDALAQMAAQEPVQSRLAVMSPALNAAARIDGGPARSLPLFLDVTPGRHRVLVTAPGFLEEAQDVYVGAGTVYAANVRLSSKPAMLTVDAPSGSRIYVDGKFAGTTPLFKPIEAEPGAHFVSLTRTGLVSRGQHVQLSRGKATRVTIDLESTSQRKAAWAFIGAGGVALAAGITTGVLSVIEFRKAREIDQDNDDSEMPPEDKRRYDDAIAARDDFRVVSGIAGGTGLALFLLGGTLFVFDNPPAVAQPHKSGQRQRPSTGSNPSRQGDQTERRATVLPVVGPGFAGGTFGLRF